VRLGVPATPAEARRPDRRLGDPIWSTVTRSACVAGGVRTFVRLPRLAQACIVRSHAVNIRVLIDAVMQQTTVLIGQLSTAAGVRAPLARVADQVFLDLARELDEQGVAKRVAADMFGLALRSYQKKIQRITESASERDSTLWQGVLEYVAERQRVRRSDVLSRFPADEEREIGAVLNDLVGTGFIYQAGHGAEAIYGITSDADLRFLARTDEPRAAVPAVWTAVHRNPGIAVRALATSVALSETVVRSAVELLVVEGKLAISGEGSDASLTAVDLVVPVGAELGWEVAVFDHFRAVVNAIAAKVRAGQARAKGNDTVGGATLSFDLHVGHPFEHRVERLLHDVRQQVATLWDDVEAYNAEHPTPKQPNKRLYFYFGQYTQVSETDPDEANE